LPSPHFSFAQYAPFPQFAVEKDKAAIEATAEQPTIDQAARPPFVLSLVDKVKNEEKTGQDKPRQDKTRQDKTRQDKTRQDKDKDKTRQDKTEVLTAG
jgi:hypothetical protein